MPVLALAESPGYIPVSEPQPQLTEDDRTEVEVVFWYGCRFCFAMEKDLNSLVSEKALSIEVIHIPAPLNKRWANQSRLYYLIERFDLPWSVHKAAYEAVIYSEGVALGTKPEIVEFLSSYDIERAAIEAQYASDSIIDNIRRDYLRLKSYGVGITPSFVIDGAWLVDGYTAGSVENSIEALRRVLEERY